MTREEAIEDFRHSIAMSKLDLKVNKKNMSIEREIMVLDSIARNEIALKALEEPCEDCISRQAVYDLLATWLSDYLTVETREALETIVYKIEDIPSVNPQPKIGHCKECKWWKDSDGAYRRGIGVYRRNCRAESHCPINRIEVLEGNGYCYMFEPQESEE